VPKARREGAKNKFIGSRELNKSAAGKWDGIHLGFPQLCGKISSVVGEEILAQLADKSRYKRCDWMKHGSH